MSKLVIRLYGREVQRVDLDNKPEWRIGRSESSDIVLQKEPGISRDHMVIRSSGDHWTIEALSRYGKISVNGKEEVAATLQPGDRFTVLPYEFEIEEIAAAEVAAPEIAQKSHTPFSPNLPATQKQNQSASLRVNQSDDFYGNDEKTSIGQVAAAPYIKILGEDGTIQQILRLEGNFWGAGRDPASAIHIADSRVSRQQFEITKQDDHYYIRDLESVNGTLINGNLISVNEPIPLISGDTISVLSNHMVFELRDANFHDRLGNLPAPSMQSYYPVFAPQPSAFEAPIQEPVEQASEVRMPPWAAKFLGDDRKTQIIRGSLIGVLLLGGLFQMMTPDSSSPPRSAAEEDPLAKLTPEQQSLIKHTYELASSLLMQGKYELASAEIAKVHELIPEYLDSREIEETTKRAAELKRQKELLERQAREANEMEEKIRSQVESCKPKLNNNITSEEMLVCLAPAMELNPEHPEILALQRQVEEILEQRRQNEIASEARQDLVQKGKNLYSRAKRLDDAEDWLEAISAYNSFLKSSYPDPAGNKSQARKRVASIRSDIDKKIQKVIQKSEALYNERNLKDAVLILNEAKKIDPDNNSIKENQKKMVSELEKEMRILYQESILEESLGKITTARDRWQLILKKDVPNGEYYKKAAVKMKRYGSF